MTSPASTTVMYRFADYTAFELLTALQAVRAVKRNSHFSGFSPRANLSHVNFLSDGTLEVVSTQPTRRPRRKIT